MKWETKKYVLKDIRKKKLPFSVYVYFKVSGYKDSLANWYKLKVAVMIVYNPEEHITRQTSRDNNLSNFSALKDPGDFFLLISFGVHFWLWKWKDVENTDIFEARYINSKKR